MSIQPKLKLFDLVMIVISMVIGVGIFRNASIVATQAGHELNFYLAWIIGGVVAACGALTFAEIGSRLPVAGGYYKMFSLCYSPTIAFMLIWTYLLLGAGAAAAVTFTGVQYIAPVLWADGADSPLFEKVLFFIVIASLFAINFMGIRTGSAFQNFMSLIKIGLVLVFVSALFVLTHEPGAPVLSRTESPSNSWPLLGAALIGVYFSYGGYQNTANLGADVQRPHRNVARGILLAMAIVIVLYLAINVAYVRVLGFETLKNTPLAAERLARNMFGPGGTIFASVAIFLSVVGYVNATLIYIPRVFLAMAEEGLLPRRFGVVHQSKQVQEFTLTFFCLLIVGMFLLLQTYENLLNYVMFNDTLALAFAAFSIFILRSRKIGDNLTGYRLRWFPLIPLVFIAMQLIVTIYIVITDTRNSLIGAGIILLGYPLYLLLRRYREALR